MNYLFQCKADKDWYQVAQVDEGRKIYIYAVLKNGELFEKNRYQYLQDAITFALSYCLPQYECEVWGQENKTTFKGQKPC